MKTSLGTVAFAVLLILAAGCSHCRWPWSRSVTTSMPPAMYPCGPAGPAAVAPGDACAPPVLTTPPVAAPAVMAPGAMAPGAMAPAPAGAPMAAPALNPTPAVPAQTYMPIQQNYTPTPSQPFGGLGR